MAASEDSADAVTIEYLQHVKGLTLQQAGNVNSGVFAAAVFATPCFGLLADRYGLKFG